jgi:hypothetical protein
MKRSPNAFTAAAQENKPFDWNQRWGERKAMSQQEIVHALNDPKYKDDRSEGLCAFVCECRRHGYSPTEVYDLLVAHQDTLLTAHYSKNTDSGTRSYEDNVRDDIPRCWKLGESEDSSTRKAQLEQMNKDFAVALHGTSVVVADMRGPEIKPIPVNEFHKMYANKFVTTEMQGENGETKQNRRSISKVWFEWKDRREYLNPGIVFEPGAAERPGALNYWRGWGVVAEPGDWSLMRRHIEDTICAGNKELSDYWVKWMARGVQQPQDRIGSVLVMRSEAQGTGKGFLAEQYGMLYGPHFKHIASLERLTGKFNASVGRSCLVYLDEAIWAADRKAEGVLKHLITDKTVEIEPKNIDSISIPNRLRIMVASNNEWVVPVGYGDRRFCVTDVDSTWAKTQDDPPEEKERKKAHWDEIANQMNHGGREAMLYDLLHMDLTGFDVEAIPSTAAKTDQARHSMRGTDAWLDDILHEGKIGFGGWDANGSVGLTITKDGAYDAYVTHSRSAKEWRPETKDRWASRVYKVMGETVRQTRPRTGGQREQHLEFAGLTACRERFAKFRGLASNSMNWDADD